ncbi:Glutamate--UDP-2-acetamido-2-deoxy-D-ribohex-3-uluronic acid aminotransferase (PLP cofactor), partial [hydrothermal vent metagenome]
MKIQFIDLKTQYASMRNEINERIQKVLDHGQYILGPEIAELEKNLAEYVGAKHCVTCASGTDALLLSLMALGVKAGDEVITSPFTFIATAETIALLGAKPVFVDIKRNTYNIDPEKIEAAITDRTKAIMPVDLYGQPADYDAINAVAQKHGLKVIEDAAQSFGATYKGEQAGALGDIGCASFFPAKPLGCYGDGGACFTDDDNFAEDMKARRVHGQKRRYVHDLLGVNARMDTIQAAIVLVKLAHFPGEVKMREKAANRYAKLLSGVATSPYIMDGATSVYAQYTVEVEGRDGVQAKLKEEGVPTAVHYPMPLHLQPVFSGF